MDIKTLCQHQWRPGQFPHNLPIVLTRFKRRNKCSVLSGDAGSPGRQERIFGDLALFSLWLVSREITLRGGRVSGRSGAAMRSDAREDVRFTLVPAPENPW
jgi:hypothetical protein